jgi:hypothetical protein
MRKQTALIFILLGAVITCCDQLNADENNRVDMTEAMKESIVYLKTFFYGYEQRQPWKHKDLSENWGSGCAVGEYEVLTTAWNVANVASIRALRYGQNDFISATIKVVDYESNLCLIELDPNAMSRPLKPLAFSEDYKKGAEVNFYWLSSANALYSGRGYLDRARVEKTKISFEKRLHYVVANISRRTGIGQVYCVGSEPVGIACWSNKNKEAGLVPGEIINSFLAEASNQPYKGFGAIGFKTYSLLDPTMRSFLKMPQELTTGVYVRDVYTIGTGSDVLKQGDVILSIDGLTLNSYGRFVHPKYDRLSFAHLITSKSVGQSISLEIWRDGRKQQLDAIVKNFKPSQMLVPYHEFDQQPEYIITGGFVLQKLTRQYLAEWGDGWTGKVSPHLYHYYRDLSFEPSPERSDVVILSYVLPANINLGYQELGQIVVEKFNGMTIRSIADILKAQKLNPDSKYDVIEFELDQPTVVINHEQLAAANMVISKKYGIRKLVNVNP